MKGRMKYHVIILFCIICTIVIFFPPLVFVLFFVFHVVVKKKYIYISIISELKLKNCFTSGGSNVMIHLENV